LTRGLIATRTENQRTPLRRGKKRRDLSLQDHHPGSVDGREGKSISEVDVGNGQWTTNCIHRRKKSRRACVSICSFGSDRFIQDEKGRYLNGRVEDISEKVTKIWERG
jgi:hypothetical protein